ncbi:hypothetical protein [Mycolicibacterium diernhoferi]|uniref:Secreted protein n=1 Tax=Mycolicibacterium diernhoferi TaxID=1801 RepID=A0A1Q4H3W2_9MYCO|nr:hypothetical protein [Mycolicibacterium diernhoferi]OJZ61215.1 hypothetical protein BRW64_27750 [Mycolicibacterium diernhoferi]OPE45617.1 hypothetical protein BV510_27765 [Mycolicibacterium diernhoferi]PEG55715.1 hypothetical protein CRI78_05520 [Mycolicibacterium diernhoferi]QYL20586.1 hypothetical protein K0O62_15985 [Mycolicibacterium diernhoferi]
MSRALAAALGVGTMVVTATPAQAEPPPARQIVYSVTTATPVSADIYFRDVDPPTWADYSHNPYVFSPKVRVDIGPDKPWVLHAALVDPDRWAMVAATSGPSSGEPMFRCELSVDGVLVDTAEGPKGALCAIRHW